MSGDVNLTFSATIDDFAQKLARMEQLNEKLIGQNRKLREANEEAGSAGGKWANAQLASLASMAAGYLTVETAIRAIGDAFAYKAEQEKKSKDVNVSVGDAQMVVIRNLSGANRQQQQEYLAALDKLAEEAPVKGGKVTTLNMAAAALSAFGGEGVPALKAVRVASKLAPDQPEIAEEIARGIGFIKMATKEESAERNAGYLIQLAAQSPSKSIGDVATNVAGKLSGIMGTGADINFASALTLAVSRASGDVHMKRSAVAVLRLGQQLLAKLPEKEGGPKTFEERMTWLRDKATPEEREETVGDMAEKLSLQAGATGPIRQLLTGRESPTGPNLGLNTEVGKVLTKILANLKKPSESAPFTADMIDSLNLTPEMKMANIQRAQEAAKEGLRGTTGGIEQGVRGLVSTKEIKEELSASGLGYLEVQRRGMFSRVDTMVGKDKTDVYQDIIRTRIAELRGEQGEESVFPGPSRRLTPTQDTLDKANKLELLLTRVAEGVEGTRDDNRNRPSPVAIQNQLPVHKEASAGPAAAVVN